jgi:hypothetical protein
MKWTLSKQTLRVCAVFSLCAVSSLAQAATITVPTMSVAKGTQTVPVTIQIAAGNENITGAEFVIEVVDPTDKITLTDLSLKPAGGGFLFSPFSTFQTPLERPVDSEVRPGEHDQLFRTIVINANDPPDFAHVNGVANLALATLKLNDPAPGTYALKISQVSRGYLTRITDDSTDDATLNDVQFINGAITVVPEPSTILMAGLAGFGLVVYGFRRRTAA